MNVHYQHKGKRYKFSLLAVMLSISLSLQAQLQPKPPLLPVKSMQSDLDILWSAIHDMHPAFGLYTAADSLRYMYETTRAQLNQPITEDAFIATIYPFISALKCGHTQIKHSKHYKRPSQALPSLPFKVLVQNNRAFITYHQIATVQTGDEIISINNTPTKDIIKHGSDLYAADGNNITFKELFLSEYDGFEDACNKYYHWQPPYTMVVKTPKGNQHTIIVDTVPANTPPADPIPIVDNYKDWQVDTTTGYLPLRFQQNGNTAWFEVHSYQYNDTLIYAKAFEEIRRKGTKNLIIDLRHNTGGDIRIAAKLLTYVADRNFQMVGDLWARIANPARTPFDQYLDPERTRSFKLSFIPTGQVKDGHYKMDFQQGFTNLLAQQHIDQTDHYGGNLVVFIDGATFSSGAHTAAAIRQYCPRAFFIGRETHGGAEGCSGGNMQVLTLPNTKVAVDFPMLRVVSVLQKPVYGHGVMPNRTVNYTPWDVVSNRDADITEALHVFASQARIKP
ncbi:peptidase S41-like protein [Chitinophaga skermanii]|uniref:Peptidase S41-like protein n=1 Tax=Chitinophaga skermanii TaxID=331697 RepID=A0A327QWE6_9BACT|nr:S41 family peptidase [Chitinophaga skermanii]RAJ08275.1 peptidase S41-like protein [Chitinophaga skermanii]